MVHNSLVYRSSSSTEAIIKRTIEGIQRLIKIHNSPQGEGDEEEEEQEPVTQTNPAMKRHWESEIKILQDAPRNADKLREILKVKQKEYDKATDRENIERLVSEIEMLKFVLFLVCRKICE
jgi:PleD family two-component response regulator